MGVDKYLNTLSEAGERDSEGQFTVALEKAALKLAEFRLAAREDFALHLLQVAVLSGAQHLSVTPEDDRISFYFDGRPLLENDVINAIENRSEGVEQRIRQLQIVLSAVHGKEETTFSVLGPTFRQTLILKNGKVDLLPQASDRRPGCCLTTHWPDSEALVSRLRAYGAYAPLELRVKGEVLSKDLDFGFSRREVLAVYQVNGTERLRTADPQLSSRPVWATEKTEETQPFVYLALTMTPQQSEFHMLSNGVKLSKETEPFTFPMLSGACSVSHLPKDLSGGGLARKVAYSLFVKHLTAHIGKFLTEYCESDPTLPVSVEQAFDLQLRDFFKADVPLPVQIYLASKEPVEFIEGEEEILKFRKEFSEVANGLKIKQMLLLYEEKAFTFWKELKLSGLSNLMRDYRFLTPKPSLSQSGTLDCCKLLLDGRTAEDWVEVSRSTNYPDDHRLRAFLLSTNAPDESEIDFCVMNQAWNNMCKFFLLNSVQSGYGEGDDLLEKLQDFRDGSFDNLPSLCNLLETDARTKSIAGCWLWVINQVVKGKLSWLQQVKMSIRLSFSNYTDAEARWMRSTFFAKARTRERESLRELGFAYRDRTFLALFVSSFPDYRTTGYKLLARQALLWESFYSVERRLSFDLSLPRQPFA